MKRPAYAILHVQKLNALDLPAAIAHNTRSIQVPNADPTLAHQVRVLRCDGDDPLDAFQKRVESAGVALPALWRPWAFEVLIALSPEHDTPPPLEIFRARAVQTMDELYNRENVFAVFEHGDEKSTHFHAFVSPICEGFRAGRPIPGKARSKVPVLSWNAFSGSSARNFRKQQTGARQYGNPTMADWQTAWAKRMAEFGYRRGIPGKRTHILNQWIQGQISAVAALAKHSREGILAALEGFQVPPQAIAADSPKQASEIVQQALLGQVWQLIETWTASLAEMSNRGHQLETESVARAALSDENAVLRERLAAIEAAQAIGLAHSPQARTKETRISQSLEELSDEEFERLFTAEAERRIQLAAPVIRPVPTPVPKEVRPILQTAEVIRQPAPVGVPLAAHLQGVANEFENQAGPTTATPVEPKRRFRPAPVPNLQSGPAPSSPSL